jgi:hypothetical protein
VSAADRLDNPHGVLSRTDLLELGWPRRGVDAIFGAVPVIQVEGFSRPFVQVSDYLEYVESRKYGSGRIRPC